MYDFVGNLEWVTDALGRAVLVTDTPYGRLPVLSFPWLMFCGFRESVNDYYSSRTGNGKSDIPDAFKKAWNDTREER